MKIEKLEIQVLVEDVSGPRGTLGEGGFAALVDIQFTDLSHQRILFDTGPSSVAFLRNTRELCVDLTTIEAIVISHGHWDHVGGLMEAIKLSKKNIPVICHPQALSPKTLKDKEGALNLGIHGFIDSIDDLKKKAKIITAITPYKFTESVMTTGEIPRINDFETLTGKLLEIRTIKDGKVVPDKLEDDLSLIFQLADDSVIILTGCCHAGIVNTATYATELTGTSKITGIIGGLHLHDASDSRLTKTTHELKKYPIKLLAPCHCSGFRGKSALFSAFKACYQDVAVGTTLTFESNAQGTRITGNKPSKTGSSGLKK